MSDTSKAIFSPLSRRYIHAGVIWFVAALFYGVEFFQRVAPGVIAHDLIMQFHLSAETLGTVISLYLAAYALAQIPVGMILDRFGPRLPMTLAAFLVSLGTLLFALAPYVWVLAIARVLVGIGSAFAFVGCLRLAHSWFPKRMFAVIVGLTNTLGVVGALFAEEPLNILVKEIGWQGSLLLTAAAGMVVCILIFVVVKNKPEEVGLSCQCPNEFGLLNVKKSLKTILQCHQTWLVALYAGLMVAPILAFAELWAVPFLESTHHLTATLASFVNSFTFIGIAVGGPVNGLIATWMGRRKPVLFYGVVMSLMILLYIIMSNSMPQWQLMSLFFAYGFFTSTMLLAFTMNAENHRPEISAIVIAFTNMVIMLIGEGFQPLIGHLLDIFGSGLTFGEYGAFAFQGALLCLPAALIINLGILIFVKETQVESSSSL